MRSASSLLWLPLLACQSGLDERQVTDELGPPPSVLVPAACGVGSAFEINGVPYASLQDAFDATVPGDTVVVCRGTHVIGETRLGSTDVTIAGETGDPADVHLTGGSLDWIYAAQPMPAARARLSGVTFDDCPVYVAFVGELLASDLRFVGPAATLMGETDAYVTRTAFTDGAGEPRMTISPDVGDLRLTLDEVTFEGNSADQSVLYARNNHVGPSHGLVRMRNVDMHDNTTLGPVALIELDTDFVLQISGGSIMQNTLSSSVLNAYDLRGPSSIRGWTVADNVVGDPAVQLIANPTPVTVADSAFVRNTWLNPPGLYGAAWLSAGPTVRFSNVDFGTGADTNVPADIGACGVDYGVIASAVIRYPSRCPR